jgi:hypothetical protein
VTVVAGPLVALISATTSAIAPATAALAQELPGARLWNVVDDGLLSGAEGGVAMPPELVERMKRLIQYAVDGGADGILLTCSQLGFVSKLVDVPVPVDAPDDASFAEVLAGGFRTVVVVASLAGALSDTLARLEASAGAAGTTLHLEGVCVPSAAQPAAAGNSAQLAEALAAAIREPARQADAVLLAQFSLAPAAQILRQELGRPVLAGPVAAAKRLRGRLSHPETATASCAPVTRAPSTADRPAG